MVLDMPRSLLDAVTHQVYNPPGKYNPDATTRLG